MSRRGDRLVSGVLPLPAAMRTALGHWALPLVLLVPATVLALPSLSAGLHVDDYVLLGILSGHDPLSHLYPSRLDIFNFFGGVERTRRMLDLGLLPWWTSPDMQVAFWRPLTALTHWVDVAAWRQSAFLMHVHSLAWFGALVVTAGLMYRRFMKPVWVAGLAALFYAVDDAHALGVAWVAGRNALIAATFGAATLISHDRWRRAGSRAGALVAPLCLALSLLASEGGAAVGGYVASHALCLERGSWRGRLAAIWPTGLVLLAWQLLYGALGYGVLGAAPGYVSPTREPVAFVRGLIANAPVMLLAQWGGPAAETYASLSGGAALARWSVAMLVLGALGVVLRPLLRQDPVARFWALGQVLALVPTGAFLPSDRYLFFVGFGAMGLVARFLAGWVDGEAWRPASIAWRAPAAALAGLLLVVHGLAAPIAFLRASPAMAGFGGLAEGASDSMPTDPRIRHQLLIIPTVPASFLVSYSFFIRGVKRQPIPAHIRLLAAGAPVELHRLDAHTLVVRLLGPAERMFRAPDRPLAPGARIELTGTEVHVKATDPKGLPRETIVRFDADLDSGQLRWIRWTWESEQRAQYVEFTPPPIGERIRVE